MATITINNLDKLSTKLNNLANIDVEKAVKKATSFVHGQAKALAPVDTGRLRGSIHQNVEKKVNLVVGKVYTNLNYAPYVEFGTGIRGNGSYPYESELKSINLAYKEDWKGMKSQPFLFPAIKGSEEYVKSIINSDIKEKIRRLGG